MCPSCGGSRSEFEADAGTHWSDGQLGTLSPSPLEHPELSQLPGKADLGPYMNLNLVLQREEGLTCRRVPLAGRQQHQGAVCGVPDFTESSAAVLSGCVPQTSLVLTSSLCFLSKKRQLGGGILQRTKLKITVKHLAGSVQG